MNIAIVEAFISLKEFALNYQDIADKLTQLENKYDKTFSDIYEALNYLLEKDKQKIEFKERKQIGFNTDNTKK